MQTSAGNAVRHVTAQLPVGSSRVHVRTTCPVAQRVDLGIWILTPEFFRGGITLTDDQTLIIQNIFSVVAVLVIDLPGYPGKFLLLLRHRLSLKDPIVIASESLLLVLCKMRILRYFHIVDCYFACDALHCGFDLIQRQGNICLCNDMADPMTQKDLHRDTRIIFQFIRHVHDSSCNAITQLVRM